MKTWMAAIPLVLFLIGCGSTPDRARPLDPDYALYSSSAQRAFEKGNYLYAERLYADALSRARQMDQAPDIAAGAYNLAVCRAELGQIAPARALLEEAVLEFNRCGQKAPEPLLLRIRLNIRQGELKEAARDLAKLKQLDLDGTLAVQGLLLEARLAWARKDALAARQLLAQARKEGPGEMELEKEKLQAELDFADEDFVAAAQALDRAVDILRNRGDYRRMALLQRRSGDYWLKVPDDQKALSRFFRSARSLHAAGDDLEALKSLAGAVAIKAGPTASVTPRLLIRLLRSVGDNLKDIYPETINSEVSK